MGEWDLHPTEFDRSILKPKADWMSDTQSEVRYANSLLERWGPGQPCSRWVTVMELLVTGEYMDDSQRNTIVHPTVGLKGEESIVMNEELESQPWDRGLSDSTSCQYLFTTGQRSELDIHWREPWRGGSLRQRQHYGGAHTLLAQRHQVSEQTEGKTKVHTREVMDTEDWKLEVKEHANSKHHQLSAGCKNLLGSLGCKLLVRIARKKKDLHLGTSLPTSC